MDFIDDALTKTKEVIGTVTQRTGEVIAAEKLKFELASLRSKRAADYKALGTIYFDIVKDDESAPDKVKAIVERIKAKDAEIERIIAEMQNARNKRVCNKCGAAIDKNSIFCNICGAKLSDSEE